MQSNQFKFTDYSPSELKTCGRAFAHNFKSQPSELRTEDIMKWFRDTAAEGIRAYGRYIGEYEYLVDQCHTTFPKPQHRERLIHRWERALKVPLVFRLALESEWGSEGSYSDNCSRVLEDAWKVAMVRANSKVVLFATHGSKKARPILECLAELRDQSSDEAPWLCIDIPWAQKRITPRAIDFDVLT
jgi:hypothetical protein